MAQDSNNLIWLDMEMTGLDPDRDRVIEIAMVATDASLNTLAESPVVVVHQPDAVLDAMDEWNRNTHGKSGLLERVRAATTDEAAATGILLAFMREYVAERASPMCGNSICQDRRFMARWLPGLTFVLDQRNHPWQMLSPPLVFGKSKNFTSDCQIPMPPTGPINLMFRQTNKTKHPCLVIPC